MTTGRRPWAAVLAGGGLRSGQVIGKTSADGTALESEPTRTPDLIATVVKAIGLDPLKQNMSRRGPTHPHRRPDRETDRGAAVILPTS